MNANELLVRTLNAAKETREKGFYDTADALDNIAAILLQFMNSQLQLVCEKRANIYPTVHRRH